jgi:hypothetical protein
MGRTISIELKSQQIEKHSSQTYDLIHYDVTNIHDFMGQGASLKKICDVGYRKFDFLAWDTHPPLNRK